LIRSLQNALFIDGTPPEVLTLVGRLEGIEVKAFNNLAPNQSIAQGFAGEFSIEIITQPNRFDIRVSMIDPQPSRPELPPELKLGGAAALALPWTKALAEERSAHRMSVILMGAHPATSSRDTVDIARKLVPGLAAPPGASEIEYRTNVPKPSKICPEIELNRLHRWETAMTSIVQIAAPSQLGPMNWNLSELVDVNTSATARVVGHRPELLDELLETAKALYEGGIEAYETLL